MKGRHNDNRPLSEGDIARFYQNKINLLGGLKIDKNRDPNNNIDIFPARTEWRNNLTGDIFDCTFSDNNQTIWLLRHLLDPTNPPEGLTYIAKIFGYSIDPETLLFTAIATTGAFKFYEGRNVSLIHQNANGIRFDCLADKNRFIDFLTGEEINVDGDQKIYFKSSDSSLIFDFLTNSNTVDIKTNSVQYLTRVFLDKNTIADVTQNTLNIFGKDTIECISVIDFQNVINIQIKEGYTTFKNFLNTEGFKAGDMVLREESGAFVQYNCHTDSAIFDLDNFISMKNIFNRIVDNDGVVATTNILGYTQLKNDYLGRNYVSPSDPHIINIGVDKNQFEKDVWLPVDIFGNFITPQRYDSGNNLSQKVIPYVGFGISIVSNTTNNTIEFRLIDNTGGGNPPPPIGIDISFILDDNNTSEPDISTGVMRFEGRASDRLRTFQNLTNSNMTVALDEGFTVIWKAITNNINDRNIPSGALFLLNEKAYISCEEVNETDLQLLTKSIDLQKAIVTILDDNDIEIDGTCGKLSIKGDLYIKSNVNLSNDGIILTLDKDKLEEDLNIPESGNGTSGSQQKTGIITNLLGSLIVNGGVIITLKDIEYYNKGIKETLLASSQVNIISLQDKESALIFINDSNTLEMKKMSEFDSENEIQPFLAVIEPDNSTLSLDIKYFRNNKFSFDTTSQNNLFEWHYKNNLITQTITSYVNSIITFNLDYLFEDYLFEYSHIHNQQIFTRKFYIDTNSKQFIPINGNASDLYKCSCIMVKVINNTTIKSLEVTTLNSYENPSNALNNLIVSLNYNNNILLDYNYINYIILYNNVILKSVLASPFGCISNTTMISCNEGALYFV